MPILKRQQFFQNDPSQPYWYSAVDGFPVPDGGIIVEPIPMEASTLVLASDGYAYLGRTLADSELALQKKLKEDPLLFRQFKSTKGKIDGQVSFDDRAYIRLSIEQ